MERFRYLAGGLLVLTGVVHVMHLPGDAQAITGSHGDLVPG